eukprot:tig00020603_g11804.t1
MALNSNSGFTADEIRKYSEIAATVKRNAYAPYSEFFVGAALVGESGKIYTGVNVENASYPLGLCAERTAICKAVSEGERKFRGIFVATDLEEEFGAPCGGCRQVLNEFGEYPVFLVRNDLQYKQTSVSELLPFAFGPSHLLAMPRTQTKQDQPAPPVFMAHHESIASELNRIRSEEGLRRHSSSASASTMSLDGMVMPLGGTKRKSDAQG